MRNPNNMGVVEQFHTVGRILNYLQKLKPLYLIASLAGALEIAVSLIIPSLYQQIASLVETGAGPGLLRQVAQQFGGLLLLTPVVCWGTYTQYKCAHIAQGRIRCDVFDHAQRRSIPHFGTRRMGEYVTLMTSDVERTASVLHSFAFRELFRFLVLFVGASIPLLLGHAGIALVALGFGLLSFLCSATLNPQVRRMGREAQEYAGDTASFLLDLMRGMPIVRVFALYDRMAAQYRALCEGIRRRRVHYRIFAGLVDGLVSICQYATQPMTFVFCVRLVSRGSLSVADAVYFSALAGVLAEGFRSLNAFLIHSQNSLVSGKRVLDFLDTPIETSAANETPDLLCDLAMEWQDVHFAYEPGHPVLSGLSMRMPRGCMIALIGPSGGGKSTILQLIQRFYLPDSGTIHLFGRDLRALSIHTVRALTAYVPQDLVLLDGTVAQNIAVGRPGCSQAQIEEAARRADIHRTIMAWPLGYETNVGERGLQLSGGQRQRIAIARAFLKDAPILLLDEITASLDSQAEAEVMRAVHTLMQGRTTLLVAHRLSTIRRADIVYDVREGRAVPQPQDAPHGPHT